ncbi:MAG TPA: protein DpdG [Trichocoleus sp.]|jgi:hypothetical protein
MSVLKQVLATPSRVKGVVRYLLQCRKQQEKIDTLEKILSPETLISKGEDKKVSRDMVHSTILECIKMGLLEREDEVVRLHPILSLKDDTVLPNILLSLILSPENSENHDLAIVIAWYLAQDFYEAPKNWQEAEEKLKQIDSELLGLDRTRFDQFEYWACYLGLAWQHNLGKNRNSVLVPDPTACLKQLLPNLFEQVGEPLSLPEFVNCLAKTCPIFELGRFREDIENKLNRRQLNHLSSVTTISLLRLQDEGLIRLSKPSDSEIFVLNDGEEVQRISHITWYGTKRGAGRP